jgi:putative transposase
MVGYRRNLIPGGTFFFTVVLEDRRSSVLVEKITSLRHAFRVTRAERPFKVDATVILPDHLHAIMTLPEGDSDYSLRSMRATKRFLGGLAKAPACAMVSWAYRPKKTSRRAEGRII